MIVPESASTNKGAHTHPTSVRLGVIDYLNVRPVYDWILRSNASEIGALETVNGVPARMNQALRQGQVDISNVSSYAFGRNAADWLLVPRMSVAAHGRVDSVLLFSWVSDWRELDNQPIALTDQSATSIELVRILSEQRYGIHPRYMTTTTNLNEMLGSHRAALVIGDRALVERHAHRTFSGLGQPYIFDLAAEWQQWTGLPFVFAVWAARADRIEAVRSSGVVELLHTSKAHGLAHLDVIAREYAQRLGIPRVICAEYLRLLDYGLGARDLEGLRAFLELSIPGFEWTSVHYVEE